MNQEIIRVHPQESHRGYIVPAQILNEIIGALEAGDEKAKALSLKIKMSCVVQGELL